MATKEPLSKAEAGHEFITAYGGRHQFVSVVRFHLLHVDLCKQFTRFSLQGRTFVKLGSNKPRRIREYKSVHYRERVDNEERRRVNRCIKTILQVWKIPGTNLVEDRLN